MHICFRLLINFCLTANAGSLHIPIKGQLVYDSSSKTADLCLSPHMCPPCVFDALCNQERIPSMSATTTAPYSTDASSSTTASTASPSTSPSTGSSSTETPSTTEASTQSVTDYTPSSASETTSTTEATEATDAGNISPTTAVTEAATTVGGGIDAEGGEVLLDNFGCYYNLE